MVQYVNAFSLKTDDNRAEVVFQFAQAFPDGSGEETPITPVADLIMSGNLARELITKLQAILPEE